MVKYRYKLWQSATDTDKDKHRISMRGVPQQSINLVHSREVAKSSKQKARFFHSQSVPSSKKSARVNRKSGGALDRGIQLYRMWFLYLKLALELEDLGVTVTTHTPSKITNPRSNNNIPVKFRTGGDGSAVLRRRRTFKVTINRSRYRDWDLRDVLLQSFDDWWRNHCELFEGYGPKIITSKDELIEHPNLFYIRADKSTQMSDLRAFLSESVSRLMSEGGVKEYQIHGLPRVDVLLNNYNALVLSLKGWQPKKICTDSKIYLRSTESIVGAGSNRSSGDTLRLKVPEQDGKPKYSVLVSGQRQKGLWHLEQVCKGYFGKGVSKDW